METHPIFVTLHYGETVGPSHFTIDRRGELIETVDENADGTPNWEEAGICDPLRGGNPELQDALRVVIEQTKQEWS